MRVAAMSAPSLARAEPHGKQRLVKGLGVTLRSGSTGAFQPSGCIRLKHALSDLMRLRVAPACAAPQIAPWRRARAATTPHTERRVRVVSFERRTRGPECLAGDRMSPQPRSAVGVPDGERKQATVFFSDLVGSTALIRALDAEDGIALIDDAIDRMVKAVTAFDGRVTRIHGDGILALF